MNGETEKESEWEETRTESDKIRTDPSPVPIQTSLVNFIYTAHAIPAPE
jgi:hypothetical protein